MQDNIENTLKALLKKFPDYKEKKEEFKKKYPNVYEVIESLEIKLNEKKEKKFIKKNMVNNYYLKEHFGLLTEEEIQRQNEVDKVCAKQMRLSYELYVDMRQRNTNYFDDVKVLLTYDYPYHLAFKIGNSMEDSEFIECSLYINDIYKIINIFLETGEKVHDV
jgi:hypothetical protein